MTEKTLKTVNLIGAIIVGLAIVCWTIGITTLVTEVSVGAR